MASRGPGARRSSAHVTSSSVSPSASPTHAAASTFETRWAPGVGMCTRLEPAGARPEVRRVNAKPLAPRLSTSSARTSAASARPTRQTRAGVCSAIAPTRGSSMLRTALPSAGRASTSSRLARAIRSMEPALSRCTGPTFSTTPVRGRDHLARSAISPVVYIPISTTARSTSGSSESRQSGTPISLL